MSPHHDLSRAKWVKSTRSTNNGGACLEVAATDHVVAVRDSKLDTTGDFPVLLTPHTEWSALLSYVRHEYR